MLDREIPTDGKPARTVDAAELLALSRPPVTTSGDVLPVAPNLIATIVSFGFMMVVPWLVIQLIDWIDARYAILDDVDPGFIAFAMGVTLVVALGTALLFLVIGMVLQFWQHHKPFASWWPFVLALPLTWVLLLPEVWVRGDSVRYWMLVGTAVALTFCVHWLALVIAREAME